MLNARMTSIGTLRIGKAACVPAPASLTVHCLAVPSEPPQADMWSSLKRTRRIARTSARRFRYFISISNFAGAATEHGEQRHFISARTDDIRLALAPRPFRQANAMRIERQFDAVADAELLKNVVEMRLDRALADREPLGHFCVAQPRGDTADDLGLAVGELAAP